MPDIGTYNRLPGVEALGRAPALSPASPPQSAEGPTQYQPSPVPSALAGTGADIASGAAYSLRYAGHAQRDAELGHAQTALMQQDIQLREKLKENPEQYATWEQSYFDNMMAARKTIAGTIGDSDAQGMFSEDADKQILNWQHQIRSEAKVKEVDHGVAALTTAYTNNLNAVVNSDLDRESRRQATYSAIEGALGKGYISAENAVKLRQGYDENIAIAQLLQMNPADRAAVLAGSLPPSEMGRGPAPLGESRWRDGGGVVRSDWQALIDANAPSPEAARRLSIYTLIENQDQDPGAVNPKSGAAGPLQFMPRTAREWGLRNPAIAGDSFRTGFKLDARNEAQLTRSLGRKPTDAELYLAWQQGAGGAGALLRNPDANVLDALTAAYKGDVHLATKAVVDNGGRTNMTAGQFSRIWLDTYARKERGGAVARTTEVGGAGSDVLQSPQQQHMGGAWIQAIDPVQRERMRIAAENEAKVDRSANEAELNRRWGAMKGDVARGIFPQEYQPLKRDADGTRVGAEMQQYEDVAEGRRTFLTRPVPEQEEILKAGAGGEAPKPPPPDMTGSFNTPLTPEEQPAYQQWLTTLAPDQRSTRDYDLQGAFKAGLKPDPKTGHLNDQFKKPSHPTFSDESVYSTPQNPGGHWTHNPDDTWKFVPAAGNFAYRSPSQLETYFHDQEEPGTTVELPPKPAPTILQQAIYDNQREGYDELRKAVAKDPVVAYAVQSGVPPPKLVMSDPRSVDARMAWAEQGAAYLGGPMPLMSQQEMDGWIEDFGKTPDDITKAAKLGEIGALPEQFSGPLILALEKKRGDDNKYPAGALARITELSAQDPARGAAVLGMFASDVTVNKDDWSEIQRGVETALVSGAGAVVQAISNITGSGGAQGMLQRDHLMLLQMSKALVASGRASAADAPAKAMELLRGSQPHVNSANAKVLLPHDFTAEDTNAFDAGLTTIQQSQVGAYLSPTPQDLASLPEELRGPAELDRRNRLELAGRYVNEGVWINDRDGGVALMLPGLSDTTQEPALKLDFDTVLAVGRQAVARRAQIMSTREGRIAAAVAQPSPGAIPPIEPVPISQAGVMQFPELPPLKINPAWFNWVRSMRIPQPPPQADIEAAKNLAAGRTLQAPTPTEVPPAPDIGALMPDINVPSLEDIEAAKNNAAFSALGGVR